MRVLVVAPHPDDEAVGCGGTLAVHALDGDDVRAIFLTSGEGGGHGRPPSETAAVREREAKDAAAVLGLSSIEFWGEPDGRLRANASVVGRLRELLGDWRPQVVYVTHDAEMHRDHRAAARIVNAAARNRAVLVRQFEVWTPLATMDHIVDITDVIDDKLAAVRCYRSQVDVLPFDEAFRGLARYRGEMHSWPGGPYAEVFTERQL